MNTMIPGNRVCHVLLHTYRGEEHNKSFSVSLAVSDNREAKTNEGVEYLNSSTIVIPGEKENASATSITCRGVSVYVAVSNRGSNGIVIAMTTIGACKMLITTDIPILLSVICVPYEDMNKSFTVFDYSSSECDNIATLIFDLTKDGGA